MQKLFVGKSLSENYKRYDTDFSCGDIEHNQMKFFLSQYKNKDTLSIFLGWNLELYKYILGWMIFYSMLIKNV